MSVPEHWTWTDADVKAARRLWAGQTLNLDDPEILPSHLRDATRDHWKWAPPPRRAKHAASDDEEPSPATSTTVYVVYRQRPRVLRGVVIAGLVLGVVWVVWRVLTASGS